MIVFFSVHTINPNCILSVFNNTVICNSVVGDDNNIHSDRHHFLDEVAVKIIILSHAMLRNNLLCDNGSNLLILHSCYEANLISTKLYIIFWFKCSFVMCTCCLLNVHSCLICLLLKD